MVIPWPSSFAWLIESIYIVHLDDPMIRAQVKDMEPTKSALDDPDYAHFAWRRYRMLMKWMALASLCATAGGLFFLETLIGAIPIHMMIATAAGVFVSVLLASALMGLVFLSSGSGHDGSVHDPLDDDTE
jgi:hypothetical protein